MLLIFLNISKSALNSFRIVIWIFWKITAFKVAPHLRSHQKGPLFPTFQHLISAWNYESISFKFIRDVIQYLIIDLDFYQNFTVNILTDNCIQSSSTFKVTSEGPTFSHFSTFNFSMKLWINQFQIYPKCYSIVGNWLWFLSEFRYGYFDE